MITDKVRPHHLERKAILYVRQSSAHQVLHNRESSALQYAMRDRKHALRRSGGRGTISIWDPLFSFVLLDDLADVRQVHLVVTAHRRRALPH